MISFSFKNLPIKRKLRYAMLITAYTVLLVTLSIQTIYDLINARSFLVSNLETLADVVGSNAEAAIMFEDSKSAERLLDGFATLQHIHSAYLINPQGEEIAGYQREPEMDRTFIAQHFNQSVTIFNQSSLQFYRPILIDRQLIGTIFIQSDLSLLYSELWKNLLVAMLAALASVLAAYVLTARLQQLLAKPIIKLGNIINDITKNEHFDRQVYTFNNDEIGQLYDCFNEMLSQIKKRDKRLQQHRETLETAVIDRTKELDAINSELKISIKEMNKAKDAALEAVKAKSIFLANMSHEIRTPMNGVLGMLELLRDTKLDKTQDDFLETAYSSANALLQIINDILDFSKIEAGKMEIEAIDMSLNNLIEDVCTLLANKAREKSLELNCYTDTRLPTMVQGDPVRLRQILTNLLGNAVKFTEKGSITVSVNKKGQEKDLIIVEFSVEDSGIGIAEEAKDKLFSAFTQADGSITRRFGGTGLGLTICQQLVSLMKGELKITSKENQGSKFYFTIKMKPAVVQANTTIDPDYKLEGVKALIVDDNKTNRRILKHYLDAWYMHYEEADNGKDALIMLQTTANSKHAFDIIYLDMNMPEMDGLMLSQAIQDDPDIRHIKRILLSSVGTITKSEQHKYGISASLSKPYRQSRLLNTTLEVMQKNHGIQTTEQRSFTSIDNSITAHIRILLVEDNIVNQKVATSMIKKVGFEHIDIADDGQKAVTMIESNRYDIVLMDCQMPIMSGYEATRLIRERESREKLKRIPIIAMTANAMTGDKEKCLSAGMDDYLSKPIKSDFILKKLMHWLNL